MVGKGMTVCWLLLNLACQSSNQIGDTHTGLDESCVLIHAQYESTLTRNVPYGEVDSTDPEVQFRHTMDVRIPVGLEGSLPALVIVHGGAWNSGESKKSADLAEFYAQRGFATYAINYTLSSSESASFPTNIQDVLCAIRTLRNPELGHRADPSRIVVMGTSSGGHLSALAALMDWPNELDSQEQCPTDYPEPLVQLAIDYFGPTDLLLTEGTEGEGAVLQMIGNTRSEDPQAWLQASPISHVDPDDPPVFIAHGSLDSVVSPDHSMTLNDAIQAVGGQSTLVMVEGGKHGMHRESKHNIQIRCVLEPLLSKLLDL
jgi:acetyl esterase/lipase